MIFFSHKICYYINVQYNVYIYFFLKLYILGAVNTAKVPKTQFPFDISLVLRRTQKGHKASLHYKSYIRLQRLDFTSFNLKNDLSSVKVETGNVQGFFICHIIVIQGIIRSEM